LAKGEGYAIAARAMRFAPRQCRQAQAAVMSLSATSF
jgi:hypothetical protein